MVQFLEQVARRFESDPKGRPFVGRVRKLGEDLKAEGLPETLSSRYRYTETLSGKRVYMHAKFLFFPDSLIVRFNNPRKKAITMTPNEGKLLQAFAEGGLGIAISHENLVKAVWGEEYSGDEAA